ncbi:hypothetical protein P5M00_16945 [Enterobacter asburiae]
MADNSMTFSNTLMQLGGEDFGRVRQGGVNSEPAFRSGNMSVKR